MAAAASPPRALCVALDWTPNTNHGGLALAIQKGWFAAAGLDVELLSPHVDGYKTTPAARLADGSAHFAITPSETVIRWGPGLRVAGDPEV
jgi:ABC-type nitrate/sulfonate/bicarbonate transport system substrate-binding protein